MVVYQWLGQNLEDVEHQSDISSTWLHDVVLLSCESPCRPSGRTRQSLRTRNAEAFSATVPSGKHRSRTCGSEYEQLGEELRQVLRRVQTQLEERVLRSVQKQREELRTHFQSMDNVLLQQHEIFRRALEELVVQESTFTCGEQEITGSTLLNELLETVKECPAEEPVHEKEEQVPNGAHCVASTIEPELEEVLELADHICFDALLDRRSGYPMGIAVRQDVDTQRLQVFLVEPGINATNEWNNSITSSQNPIEVGDVIMSVNSCTDLTSIMAECKKCDFLRLRVAKPVDFDGESEASGGTTQAHCKPKRNNDINDPFFTDA